MRRLSTIFLVCFLAVLAGLSGVVAWKVMGRRAPTPVHQPPQQAEYQIKDVRINETLDGNLRWTLDADQAEVYDQRGDHGHAEGRHPGVLAGRVLDRHERRGHARQRQAGRQRSTGTW